MNLEDKYNVKLDNGSIIPFDFVEHCIEDYEYTYNDPGDAVYDCRGLVIGTLILKNDG